MGLSNVSTEVNKKSIYITGIAGLIGSTLAKYYLKKGWYVTGCDSLIGGYETNVPKAIKWQKIDILDKDFESSFVRSNYESRSQAPISFDLIIHTAASAHEGLSVISPHIITQSVLDCTIKMASLAINYKAKLFINCSSMARYGIAVPPFKEDMVCLPVDPYGLAKLQSEDHLTLLSDIYPEFKYYTVVPHNVCGAQQVYNDPYRNVLSIMIHQALQGFPIFIYGDGKQLRSFSHVDDCVEAISKLVEIQPTQKVFNIGPDGNHISILELANLITARLNSNSPIIHLAGRAQEVKEAYCDSTLSKTILGYESKKSVVDIIDDIQEFILLNGFKEFNYNLPLEIKSYRIPKTWSKKLFGKDLKEINTWENEKFISS